MINKQKSDYTSGGILYNSTKRRGEEKCSVLGLELDPPKGASPKTKTKAPGGRKDEEEGRHAIENRVCVFGPREKYTREGECAGHHIAESEC